MDQSLVIAERSFRTKEEWCVCVWRAFFDKCAYCASACVCVEPSHAGNLSQGRALIDENQQRSPYCVRRLSGQ